MDKSSYNRGQALELSASLAVFLLLLMYTYGILVVAPYSGFYFNPTSEQIRGVFTGDESLLKNGDVVKQIGDITLKQFKADRRLTLFEGVEKGDVIEIVIVRGDERTVVPWEFPGFTPREFANRLFNSWPLAYAFGLAGFAAQLTIRPRNVRRGLFIAANYLTALFLISGTLSSWHLWESSTLLHAVSWLMLPVFIHLHWVFPHPLRNVPNLFWQFLYGASGLLAMGEIFHVLPRSLYAFGFIIAILGSAILLFARFIVQKKERPAVRLLLLSILVGFSFSISVAIALSFGVVLNLGWLTSFSMPFMPLMYFYVIYSHQSGGLQIRLNRLVSLYAFFILLGILLFLPVIPVARVPIPHEAWIFIAMVVAAVTGILSILLFPRFQALVDQRFLGIKLPYQHLPETYSSRIAVSASLPSLLALLEDEIFPSLLVRQYAFLQVGGKNLVTLLAKNTPDDAFDFDSLTQKAGHYLPALSSNEDWTRLILPLKVGDKTLGFWLLGRRDPDDLYSQVEIPILQSLANQTAVALSNILQSEHLRNFYQTDIESIENERKRISRDLHDAVLNPLATMRNSLDQRTLPQSFLSTYEDIKKRLREIINDLRPPMLDQGLAYALNEFVEDLREKNEDVNIVLSLQAGAERLPEKMEEHFYHIAREACENALRHADARTLTISGAISSDRVDLSIEDDGKGFDSNGELNTLIANRHFGLANMKERAHIIGAEMEIRSRKNNGTSIRITWKLKS